MLANAAAAHEDLRLEQLFSPTGFTLHVVHGFVVLNVGVEAEDHEPKWKPPRGR
jgi:hypothetical protein